MKYYISFFLIIIYVSACTSGGQTEYGENNNRTPSKKSHFEKVVDSLVDNEIGLQNIESKLSERHLQKFRDTLITVLLKDDRLPEGPLEYFNFEEFLFNTYNKEPFIQVTYSFGNGASITRLFFYYNEQELHLATIDILPNVQAYLETNEITIDKIQFRLKDDLLVLMGGGYSSEDSHCCPSYQLIFSYEIQDESLFIADIVDIRENTEI